MKYEIAVENIKCGGCANSIRNKLISDASVNEVIVNKEEGIVTIDGTDDLNGDALAKQLASMGYPAVGTGTGFQKAKSYVSCMIGRMAD